MNSTLFPRCLHIFPIYTAPEVINRKPYDQKVDMWSIGVTCYLLLCGDTPFNGKNRQQLFRRISCDDPAFPDDKWGQKIIAHIVANYPEMDSDEMIKFCITNEFLPKSHLPKEFYFHDKLPTGPTGKLYRRGLY